MKINKNGILKGKEFNEVGTNYTVIGSPVFDGFIVSKLAPGKYIDIPIEINTNNSKIGVYFEGLLGEHKTTSASIVDLINSENNYQCRLYENQYGGIDGYFNGSYGCGANHDMATTGTFRIEWEIIGTTNTVRYYENNSLISSGTKTISSGLNTVVKVRFGGQYSEWTGKLDLSTVLIKRDDVPVYSPATNGTFSSYQITACKFYEI